MLGIGGRDMKGSVYGGMGYGLFFANSSKDGQSNTPLSPGFNLIAGARYALSSQWAFFGDSFQSRDDQIS